MENTTAEPVVDAAPPPPPAATPSSVIVPLEEFTPDLELRLGRANGNIYHRREGIEGRHDGQIMVRLKKKRFIIIDYGIQPNQEDLQAAAIHPNVTCPDGAGRTTCVSPQCQKVGVPVLLYDSEPTETASLYLRSGLCFTCQRNLNEKRRTQRKRKGDVDGNGGGGGGGGTPGKRIKMNGEILELTSDALVINGPFEGGVKRHSDGYSPEQIGPDAQMAVRDAAADTERLFAKISGSVVPTATTASGDSTSAVALAAAAAASEPSASGDASSVLLPSAEHNALYEKAFLSLSKSLYLLSQYKAAWDAAHLAENAAVLAVASEAAAAMEGLPLMAAMAAAPTANATAAAAETKTKKEDVYAL